MTSRRPDSLGLLATAGVFIFWGLVPPYWKLFGAVAAPELASHRVVWSLPILLVIASVTKQWPEIRRLFSCRRTLLLLACSTVMIGANWTAFLWAVEHDRIIDASLGYYINPLVSILFGMLFLGERLRRLQVVAVLLATLGVSILTGSVGHPPWAALILASSFGLYGLLRKVVATGPLPGLVFEITCLTPLCLGYLMSLQAKGAGAFSSFHGRGDLLLASTGLITVFPLVLFVYGARRVPLSSVGFLQYLTPTGHFLFAVVVYHEPFTATHGLTFACIWVALLLYSSDLWQHRR